jgi:uncharacterized protein (UPF0335 family)
MSVLKTTIEKIRSLEAEKASLLEEIGELRKMVDAKAISLEHEVALLRDEVKSLKIIVNIADAKVQNKKQF